MRAWTWAIVLMLFAWSRPAAASTRLAVVVLADDAALSNNLTEVAISSLAEKPGYELLGMRELEGRLNELSTVRTEGLRACLTSAPCLAELGALVGAERAVIGDVRSEGERFRLEFSLVDMKTAAVEARLTRESSSEVDALIGAVQAGVFELVPDAVPAPQATPPAPATSPPPKAQTTRSPSEKTQPTDDKRSDSVMPYVAYGTAALAVVAFSAAVVTGTLGAAQPSGSSRAEVQADLAQHKDYAALANGLYVTGGVLAGVSLVAFVIPWN